MVNNSEETMGSWGTISLISGIASCFFEGLLSVFIGFLAVAVGFFGVKKHQIFSRTGMIIGSFSLIFFNLISLGIVPASSFPESDKAHLINSINASIKAFDILKTGKLDNHEKEKLINCLENGLREAEMVNIKKIDNQVPGFEEHFKNEFINGMKLFLDGYKNSDISKKLNGGFLMDKWGVWNKENNKSLGKIKESQHSLVSVIKRIIAG